MKKTLIIGLLFILKTNIIFSQNDVVLNKSQSSTEISKNDALAMVKLHKKNYSKEADYFTISKSKLLKLIEKIKTNKNNASQGWLFVQINSEENFDSNLNLSGIIKESSGSFMHLRNQKIQLGGLNGIRKKILSENEILTTKDIGIVHNVFYQNNSESSNIEKWLINNNFDKDIVYLYLANELNSNNKTVIFSNDKYLIESEKVEILNVRSNNLFKRTYFDKGTGCCPLNN